jgi:NhaA family Na+:H+ antiporter
LTKFCRFSRWHTGIVVEADWMRDLTSTNDLGIAAGLVAGKPLGVTFLCFLAIASGICRLPSEVPHRAETGKNDHRNPAAAP